MTTWSDARRRVWRWGWTALAVGVLFCPVSSRTSCDDAGPAGASGCTTRYVPLVGALTGSAYPAP